MPAYNFKCKKCNLETREFLSIAQYSQSISDIRHCIQCGDGILLQNIKSANGTIDRRASEIIEQAQDDARKLGDKVRSGNEQAIRDVYGETKNPLK